MSSVSGLCNCGGLHFHIYNCPTVSKCSDCGSRNDIYGFHSYNCRTVPKCLECGSRLDQHNVSRCSAIRRLNIDNWALSWEKVWPNVL